MTKLSKPKKLTRIDVLIVVFVCLFVCLLILCVVGPAFYHARSKSIRFKCGKKLNDIGKAMRVYANDYDGVLPRSGGRNCMWSSHIQQWLADNPFVAYGLNADGTGGSGTITSCFYLLVKHSGIAPKTFVCPGDKGTTEFKPIDDGVRERELTDLWDFGLEPREHCSYSYHMPFGLYPLTNSSEPGMAVAADRNPWIGSPTAEGKDPAMLSLYNPNGRRKETNVGNAIAHQEEGQNVLFVDTHVGYEKRPFCGINDDNIYTFWDGGDIRRGGLPYPGCEPMDRLDSFLVNDFEASGFPIQKRSDRFMQEVVD